MTDTRAQCLSFGELADYWTADVSGPDAERIEAHVFDCRRCARLIEQAEALRTRVRALMERGGVRASVTEDVLNELARNGVRVRTYSLRPGDSIQCTVWGDDEVMVARLRADFSGITAVDAEMGLEDGTPWSAATEVPVGAGAAELLLVMAADSIRTAPEIPMRVTLRASGTHDGPPLAEYVFDHRGSHERR